jgi:two-component system, cell cycle response regulator
VKSEQATWTAHELVPLADRLRYMRFLRVALVAAVAVVGGLDVGGIAPSSRSIWPALLIYVGVSGAGEAVWRVWRRRGLWLFGLLLVVDAAFLVYAAHVTGGPSSPLRYLVVLHLIAVALLASYRTGLKLVIWYVLLMIVELHVHDTTSGTSPWQPLPGGGYAQLAFFATVLAAVTLGTASLSAVNERELRRRRFDLEALATLAGQLEQASTVESVAERTVESVAENFDIDRVALVATGVHPRILAAHGLDVQLASGPLDVNSVINHASQLRSTLLPAELDPTNDGWLSSMFTAARNVVVTPLFAEGGCVGVLVFEHGVRRGSRIERRLLTIIERFASHTALALRNATLLAKVQEAAATDALTGIANRRAFEEALDREIARSIRTGEPLSLVMLDLDHFKQLNDSHGHQMGDHVLAQVASALRSQCRDMDVAARYGGEEFTVILPNCSADEVATSAARLWAGIGDAEQTVPLTVSAGYATFPDNATTGRDLIGAADQALYEAKRTGRNRIVGCARSVPRTQLGIVANWRG